MGAVSSWKIALIVNVLFVLFIATKCKVTPLDMIGMRTWQSSTYIHHGVHLSSNLAVDGSRDADTGSKFSCAHTNGSPSWWAVDLGKIYHVDSITITNRADCCSDRLQQFFVRGSLKSHIPSEDNDKSTCLKQEDALGSGATETLACNKTIVARYIIIEQESNPYLTLCEVVVNVAVIPLDMTGMHTWQSSTYIHHGVRLSSNLAVDGSRDVDTGSKFSCAHTNGSPSWWTVDLGNSYQVDSITITNRGDCCSDRLQQFSVYGSLKSHIPSEDNDKSTCLIKEDALGSGATETLPCDRSIGARYIIIEQESNPYLTLCEVVVNVSALDVE